MSLEKSAEGAQHEKERHWEAPPLRELKETKNDFQDYKTEVVNFFRLLLLAKVQYGGTDFSASDAKGIFQSPRLVEEELFKNIPTENDTPSYNEFWDYNKYKDVQLPAREKIRQDEAIQKNGLLPLTENAEQNSDGYFPTPRFRIPGAGTFLTNRYRSPDKQPMKMENFGYRVNLALIHNVSNWRVKMDLYELLSKNKALSEHGFDIKSLGNDRTDAIIVYCGENGVTPAITEVGNYCLQENIGHVSGVPFGVAPLAKDGKFEGLRVTSSPKPYTFNELQATALSRACEEFTRDFLKRVKSDKTFADAGEEEFTTLHTRLAWKDEALSKDLEQLYTIELKKLCGTEEVNLHNLAFPTIKKQST